MAAGGEGNAGEAERWVRQAGEAIARLQALGIDAFAQGGRLLAVDGADHLYRVFFETMGEAAATLDDDGVVLHANPRMAALFKMPIERLRGTCLLSALEGLPTDLDATSPWRGRVVLHADGGTAPFLCTMVPVRGDGAAFRCIVLADLTEVERAEREAQERGRQLSGLAQAVPGGLVRVRVGQGDVAVEFATEAVFRLLELPVPAARPDVGELWKSLSPLVRSALMEAWDAAGDVGLLEAELPVAAADGSRRWVGLEARPERQKDGTVLWNGYLHDITPAKRAEEERLLAAAVFDSARQGIMVTREDGTILHVNPGFELITGYPAEEAVGKPAKMLASGLTPPEVYTGMWSALKHDGHWEGELLNRRRNGEIFHELLTIDAVPAVDGGVAYYVGVFGDITARKKKEERNLFLAQHDPLTGLMNRSVLDERLPGVLALADRSGEPVAVLFIDLDHFKEINDRHGHGVGDRVLEASAHRILASVRSTDLAVRQGGDEFIVVMPGLGSDDAIRNVCEALLAALQKTIDVDGLDVAVDASIGVAVYPDDGRSPQELLARADAAMYAAKKGGRGGFRFHAEARNARLVDEARRVEALERALAIGRTSLDWCVFAAGADAAAGPVALEARLRATDGEGRPIDIPADLRRSDASLACALGLRELALVAEAIEGGTLPAEGPVPVSFALAVDLLADDDAFERLKAALPRNAGGASRLAIRLPWAQLAALKPEASARLEALRATGALLHIDEVGRAAPLPELLAVHRPALVCLAHDAAAGAEHAASDAFVRAFTGACRAAGVLPCAPCSPTGASADDAARLGFAAVCCPVTPMADRLG